MRVALAFLVVVAGCAGVATNPAAPRPRPELMRVRDRESIAPGGCYESPVLHAARPFREALVSWNVATPEGLGFWFELCVRRVQGGGWSPWLYVGDWNLPGTGHPPTVEFDGGQIDVDFLVGLEDFDALRYRVCAATADSDVDAPGLVDLHQVTLCLMGSEALPPARGRDRGARGVVLDVPLRSQRVEDEALAPRICSPTSVAMMLAYHGVERPTAEVAERLYDARHDIYGNWTRALQGAFSYGVPGYLRSFAGWGEVEELVASGQPLVASVRVGEGELDGAPYAATPGHLLVIVGFDSRGDVVVNDPAAPTPEETRRVYARADVERVWLDKGGVAYVFTRP